MLERFQLAHSVQFWALHFKNKQLEKVQGRAVGTITDLDNITSEERMGLIGPQKEN